MRNQSAYLRLNRIRKLVIGIKGNGIRSEQDLGTQVTKRMQHYLRISMHLTEDRDFDLRSRRRLMVGKFYIVGLVVERIIEEIVYNIRVVGLRSIVHMKHEQWGMLDRVFHKSMHR